MSSTNLATPKPSRPSSPPLTLHENHPQKLSVVIPPTPTAPNPKASPIRHKLVPTTLTSLTCATPISGSDPLLSVATETGKEKGVESRSATGVIPPDMLAVGEILSTMKSTLNVLGTTFDSLGQQTTKVATLGPAMEATHQIRLIRTQLREQYARQEARMKEVRALLENAIKELLAEQYKTQVYVMIQEAVQREVKERVKYQLNVQIPQNLRQQVMRHKRQILEVQTSLHNSEARRYNATLRSASLTETLRPLLRPLPTPAQSPAYILSKPFPIGAGPSPITPTLLAPTPTPTTASAPNSEGEGVEFAVELEPPTPSPRFPRDLRTLFNLSPDAARMLVTEYGIGGRVISNSSESGEGSPANENQSTTSSPTRSGDTLIEGATDADSASREHNLTKFMAYIGVPLQMVPAPTPKTNTKSSRAGRPLLSLITSISPNSL